MQVDVSELEVHRSALTGHCYRMLGSSADADDAVQETMVRAWRSLDRYEGRSSLRTWLYRIATNVCLDTLSDGARRMRPFEEGPATRFEDAKLDTRERKHWLEPIPDARALPADADPFELTSLKQSIRLAFVAALQHLPPRQRAALLLTDVLGSSAAEVAETLDMTVAAVNSSLQRARATMASRKIVSADALEEDETELLDRYVDAFTRYDVDELVSLLRDDATFSMPPFALWLQGPDPVRQWLNGPGQPCRGSRLVRVAASGSPAFAQYRRDVEPGTFKAWGLIVLELDRGRIAGWNSFLDTETLFPMFGLPLTLS
ncbi:MAG TPA: sigma-70 family RNA polymerase sigma factor [Thermoanaerobaculia bacterium]|jgi:RNA polymerase sigma-70 factor (ECF subfamily)|nr:sigma-70 family RNA polymerase sigma factor [Thermoanaerobaculia bacterium]